MKKHFMRGLYLVTPDWDDTDRLLAATDLALMGGASLVQYRHKTASPELRVEQAAVDLVRENVAAPSVLNSLARVPVPLDAGLDGVE